MRKFPFRHGEGEFRASVDLAGLTLDYYPGFAPLTEAAGRAEFRDASIEAQLEAGRDRRAAADRTRFRLGDYKTPVLEIEAKGSGDLQKALAFVQASPLGPRIGAQFMGLRGNGPARYDVSLTLPVVSDEARAAAALPVPERDYFVRATLQGANVSLPALRAPAQRVTGVFELHNEAISIPSMRGTILDGPFELQASPGRPARDVLGSIDLTAQRAGRRCEAARIHRPACDDPHGGCDRLGVARPHRKTRHGQLADAVRRDQQPRGPRHLRAAARSPRRRPRRARRACASRFRAGAYNDITHRLGQCAREIALRDRQRAMAPRSRHRPIRRPARGARRRSTGLLVTGDWPQFDLAEWLALGEDTGGAAQPVHGTRR